MRRLYDSQFLNGNTEATYSAGTNAQGKAIASVLELPNCLVEATTREQALEELKKLLQTPLEKIKIIPMEVQLSNEISIKFQV